jgi:hypothetical protein
MTRSKAAPVMLGGAMVFPQMCLRVEKKDLPISGDERIDDEFSDAEELCI